MSARISHHECCVKTTCRVKNSSNVSQDLFLFQSDVDGRSTDGFNHSSLHWKPSQSQQSYLCYRKACNVDTFSDNKCITMHCSLPVYYHILPGKINKQISVSFPFAFNQRTLGLGSALREKDEKYYNQFKCLHCRCKSSPFSERYSFVSRVLTLLAGGVCCLDVLCFHNCSSDESFSLCLSRRRDGMGVSWLANPGA